MDEEFEFQIDQFTKLKLWGQKYPLTPPFKSKLWLRILDDIIIYLHILEHNSFIGFNSYVFISCVDIVMYV